VLFHYTQLNQQNPFPVANAFAPDGVLCVRQAANDAGVVFTGQSNVLNFYQNQKSFYTPVSVRCEVPSQPQQSNTFDASNIPVLAVFVDGQINGCGLFSQKFLLKQHQQSNNYVVSESVLEVNYGQQQQQQQEAIPTNTTFEVIRTRLPDGTEIEERRFVQIQQPHHTTA